MTRHTIICAQCTKEFEADSGRINRAKKERAPLYCDRTCAGLARRLKNPPTLAERKAAKSTYDRAYRERNAAQRKRQKAAYYQRTRDPKKEAERRAKRMHLHVAYCQRPEYKAYKRDYDKRYRAKQEFGAFAEAALLLGELEQQLEQRATRYEIYRTNGTLNKALMRRRAL